MTEKVLIVVKMIRSFKKGWWSSNEKMNKKKIMMARLVERAKAANVSACGMGPEV